MYRKTHIALAEARMYPCKAELLLANLFYIYTMQFVE